MRVPRIVTKAGRQAALPGRARRALGVSTALAAVACASLFAATPAAAGEATAGPRSVGAGGCGSARSSIGFTVQEDAGSRVVCWQGHGDRVITDIDVVGFNAGPDSSGYFMWSAGGGECVSQTHFKPYEYEYFENPIDLCSIHFD